MDEVVLSLDEYESVRLADFEELYQEQAAVKMGISRQTFGRIIESAHKKIADVLIHGKALKIEGGEIAIKEMASFTCRKCHRIFATDCEEQDTKICPHCRIPA